MSRFTPAPLRLLVIVPVSVLWVGLLFGANLRAQWSVFDDHEIMWFTGSAERLPPSQIFPKLMLTEVGPHSDFPRFRPAYYFLRLFESWVWGRHPGYWYAAHLGILAFFVATIWALASSRMGLLASGFLVAYTSALPFWSGIFSALGPGETYATLGLALFLLGADFVFRRSRPSLGWGFLLVGTLIAAGSKENMLLLPLPLLLLLWYEVKQKGSRCLASAVVAFALGWCGWIAFVVLSRVQAAGADQYANPIGARQRLAVLLALFGNARMLGLVAVAVVLAALSWFLRERHPAVSRTSLAAFAWTVALNALYASQFVFYNGIWPTGMRYDFPGMLAWPALLVVIAWFIHNLTTLSNDPWIRRLLEAVIPVMSLVLLSTGFTGVRAAQIIARNNVAATSGWTTLVERISAVARQHEGFSLVIQSNDPADYEPVIGFPRFLNAFGARNPTYLLWTPHRQGVVNYLGSLSEQLVAISEKGASGAYLPLSHLDAADTRCILIVISGRPRWPCQITLDGDWRPYYQR